MTTGARTEAASGTGLATVAADGTVLDTWYPAPALGRDAADVLPSWRRWPARTRPAGSALVVRTEIGSLADPPIDAPDAYLRLHLLSHRLIGRTRRTWTASSACWPTWSGPTPARAR